MKELLASRLLARGSVTALPALGAPSNAQLSMTLVLARGGLVDLVHTADALATYVRQRIVVTGQHIELGTKHHAHEGALALTVIVPAAWVIDEATGRAGLRWSMRFRGRGIKHAHDVFGSVLVTALGAAKILEEHDGIEVAPRMIELELDDRVPARRTITFAVVRELGLFLRGLFPTTKLALETQRHASGTFRVRVKTPVGTTLDALTHALHALAEKRTPG